MLHKEESTYECSSPEQREAAEADPTRVEQEGGPCCLKLHPRPTTDFKAETSAGEGREEGVKHRAGWLGLLFWRRMDATHQAGIAASVTRDWCHALLSSALVFGMGMWPCPSSPWQRGPAPGTRSVARSHGVFRKKMVFEAGLVQTPAQPQVF